MAYDPNWLAKAQAKQRPVALSHIKDISQSSTTALCGRGYGAKGSPSITFVSFPSVNDLPGCRTCREKFLESIGVAYNHLGYPLNK